MKKNILITCLILATSCSYNDRQVRFDLNVAQNQNDTVINKSGALSALKISVIEQRKNPEIVGTKKIGDQKVKITSTENLAKLLEEKISENLFEQGFKKGNAKQLELYVEKFQFTAKRRFFIGKSEAKTKIKAVVKDSKNNVKFTKNFELSLNNKHFIASFESTDEATINQLLNEVAQDIVSDKSLLENLSK
jgi:uncharacterized lipoprotein YajG